MKGSAPVFDREFQLLLACSKVPSDGDFIRSLAGQVEDWEKFLRYAEWHELTPLISHGLIDSAFSLPSATSETLASKAHENTKKNLLLTAELLRIMQALLGEEIRGIPYKGPVLAASAYGNLAMRGFCDLDILIAKRDVPHALSVMYALGFEAEYNLTPAQHARYLRRTCEYNFVNKRNQTQAEIHWQVVPVQLGLAVDFDQFWSRSRLFPVAGAQLQVLSPEDALLVLSIHGFKHLWSCLKWVCDIAALLSSAGELDWSYVFDEAERIGAGRIVLIAVFLANKMFQSRLPDPILLRLGRDPISVSIAMEIMGMYSPGASMTRLNTRLLTARAYPDFRRRASYVARTLLDPTTEDELRTPERPIGLMRTQRVFRIAWEAISDLANRKEIERRNFPDNDRTTG